MSFRLFRSVRFNIGLFAVLAAASALGTLLPQVVDAPAKVEEFMAAHPSAGFLMDRAGLFNLYHSWWYVALLGLMAFDVVVCKLRSLPREVHAEEELSDRLVAASPLKDRFETDRPLDAAAEAVKRRLGERRYACRELRSRGEVHIWAAKHRLQRWGDFVLHVSIVAILVGAFFGSLRGFEEFLPVTAGGRQGMKHRAWSVAVDDFLVDFYKDTGAARTYQSQVRVVDAGRVVGEKRIRVNDPLDIGGVRFYQASWGMTGMLRSATLEVPRPGEDGVAVRVPRGERVPLEGTGLTVSADLLLPDFVVNAQGRADTQGLEPNNPAVLFSFFQGDKPIASLWLLEKQPFVAFKVKPDQTVEPAAHPPFRLGRFEPVLFSGIQVAYDPGVRVVALGCLALLAGLVIHFYFHQRRVRVLLSAGELGTIVHLGGWNSRNPVDFDAEFQSLAAALRL